MQNLWKATLVEFVGTLILVAIGASAVAQNLPDGVSTIVVALAFGMVLMALFYFWCECSGARHFNPVFTLLALMDGRICWLTAIMYWIAQFVGAIVGGAIVLYFYGSASGVGISTGSLTNTDPVKAMVVEGFLTFFLTLGFLHITHNPLCSMVAAFVIGALLLVCMLAGYTLTGASLNPARTLGTGVYNTQSLSGYWIYFFGPFIGGIIAWIVYKIMVMQWGRRWYRQQEQRIDVYNIKIEESPRLAADVKAEFSPKASMARSLSDFSPRSAGPRSMRADSPMKDLINGRSINSSYVSPSINDMAPPMGSMRV